MIPEPCTTGAFIRELRATRDDALCISLAGRRLSYREAEEQSRRWAKGLLATGIGKGTRVGLLMPNGPDWVSAWLAVTRIGALLVPLNTFYQARELGWVLRHADVDTLLCVDQFLNNDYLERLAQFAPEIDDATSQPLRLPSLPFLRSVRIHGSASRPWARSMAELEVLGAEISDTLLEAVEAEVTPADPMILIYSSGSTADPKGAIHTHGSVLRHAHNLNGFRDLRSDDRMYSPMPFFWVGGFVFSLLSVMHAGASLLAEEFFEPEATLALLEKERATLVAGWPHYSKALAEHPSFASRDLSSIRGGNLYDLLPEEERPKDLELRSNSLGMTETAGPHTIDFMTSELPEALRGAFGRAVPGMDHKIVDPETGAILGPDQFGEIFVRGPSLMQGLYKQEREAVFDVEGFYPTGDAGHFNPDGYLFFKSRLGDLIKTAGANVTPREVESVLETLPAVRQGVVVGVSHAERGENVAAAIVLREGESLSASEVREALKSELSAYKLPRHVWFLEAIPMTDSGKVDKKTLRSDLEARIEAGDTGEEVVR